MSKTFDNGVICASEQSVVVVDSVYDAVRERFATHGGYLLQGKELKAVQDVILKNGALNAAIVGQPAYKIAELAGFSVPENTKIRRRGRKSRETGCYGRYRSYLLPVH